MTNLYRFFGILATALACTLTGAEALPPDALVRQITADVLAAINKDKDLQAGDRAKALTLAEAKVLPHIDFEKMTMLAVGKSWRRATPEQRQALTREFRTLLIRTYANSIGAYSGQNMEIAPLRMSPQDIDVTVRNRYLSPGSAPVPIDYRMHKTDTGWKTYDIVVDGISLVMTYRSSFSEEIHRSGIQGLLRTLTEKNDLALTARISTVR